MSLTWSNTLSVSYCGLFLTGSVMISIPRPSPFVVVVVVVVVL